MLVSKSNPNSYAYTFNYKVYKAPLKTVSSSYSPPPPPPPPHTPHKDTYGAPAHPVPVVHQGGAFSVIKVTKRKVEGRSNIGKPN